MSRLSFLALAASLFALEASATCRNAFVARTEGQRQVVTLLTGKMTYQEAQQLAEEIAERKVPPLEWVDAKGKVIAKQFGELKVIRPMPVRCDDKPSGVVLMVTFPALQRPSRTMTVKLGPDSTIEFEEQE